MTAWQRDTGQRTAGQLDSLIDGEQRDCRTVAGKRASAGQRDFSGTAGQRDTSGTEGHQRDSGTAAGTVGQQRDSGTAAGQGSAARQRGSSETAG